jgi:membrane-associated phospholipid phosphatase
MTFPLNRPVRVARDLLSLALIASVAGYLLLRVAPFEWMDGAARTIPGLHDHAVLNAVAVGITAFGEESTLAVSFLGLTIYAYRTRGRWWGHFFMMVMVGALALDNLVKPLVGRARPSFEQLVAGRGPSFPSGHVIGTTALLVAIAFFSSARDARAQRYALWVAAAAGSVLMGLSRVYLGVHWPTDVIAGAVLGAGWTFISLRSLRSDEHETRHALLLDPVIRLSERALKSA